MKVIPQGREHLVVGVDGSENSRVALEWALELAARLGAALTVVTTWHYLPQPASISLVPAAVTPQDQRDAGTYGATALVAAYAGGPVAIEHRIVRGDATTALVEISDGALALVVGTRGHSLLGGALLGSVSRRCVTHGRCPVIVVPSPNAVPSAALARQAVISLH